jgi:DNA replication protein DnaC
MTTLTEPRVHVSIETQARECEHHGGYIATLWALSPMPANPRQYRYLQPFWSSCPTCDAAMQAAADEAEAMALGGLSASQRIASLRCREAEIPARFVACDLSSFVAGVQKQRTVLQACKDYADGFEGALSDGRCLILSGTPGSGKTHLAVAVLRAAMAKGATGRYATVMGMLGRIKATYGKDPEETERQAAEAFVSPDLLVLDEVARQTDSNYEHMQVFHVLNARYNEGKPTVIVSNLSGRELRGFLGEAVWDRLRENGGKVLACDWESHRATTRGKV